MLQRSCIIRENYTDEAVPIVDHDKYGEQAGGACIGIAEERGLHDFRFLTPEEGIGNLNFADIADLHAIQSLMNHFYDLVHVPMTITDLKGQVLAGVGWQDICTKFHRSHPETRNACIESDLCLSAGIARGESKLYRCKNNMWDIATPIMVGNQQVANLFSGQFFFEGEPLDRELFRAQARKFGFVEEEYLAALQKVPRLSRDVLDTAMAFFVDLAAMLSELSYSNVRLARSLAERDSLMATLGETGERLRLAVEAAELGTWDFDPISGRVDASEACKAMFGIAAETPVDYAILFERMHPDDRQRVHEVVQQALLPAGDGKYSTDFRSLWPDGTQRWLSSAGRAFFNTVNGERRSVRFIGTTLDVTRRKRGEEALHDAQMVLERLVKERTADLVATVNELQLQIARTEQMQIELVQSAQEIEDLYNNAPCGYHSLDRNGVFLHINATELRWLGFSREEVVKKMRFDDVLHPKSRAYFQANFNELKASGIVSDVEYELIRKDGSPLPVMLSASALYDERGGFVMSRATVFDLTHQKEIEARLKEKDRLLMQQNRLAAMGEMIGNIAHQWRQPINTLGLLIQRLPLDFEFGDLTKEALDTTAGEAMEIIEHMSQTIDDFRNFFRPDKEMVNFSVNEVVQKTLALLRESLKNKGIDLSFENEGDPHILGFPNEFCQVISNILNNARDALAGRKPQHASILTRVAIVNGRAVVTITDNGGGIPEEIVDRIFEPYFTTKEQGTGIGLFMSKNIIEKNMNGRLSVRNTGEGAEFRIEL